MQAAITTTERRTLLPLEPEIEKYLQTVASMSQSSARTYRFRLYPFVYFLQSKRKTFAQLLTDMKAGTLSIYDVLGDYAGHLQKEAAKASGVGATSVKRRVSCVKLLLIYHDVDINETKFKAKVKFAKSVRREKEAIDKNDIRKILLSCDDKRIKTYLMLLSGTGMRAKEALNLRFADFDLKSNPARVNLKGEYTKTRTDRYVFLTKEFVNQFQDYIAWRHRERALVSFDKLKHRREIAFAPTYRATDLVFTIPHRDPKNNAAVDSLYMGFIDGINAVIDRVGLGELERGGQNRKITRHTFRRFVKSVISDLGYGDYSEWFIGHAGSTYYRKKDQEKAEIFGKVEPYLTFLDAQAIEAGHADIQTKVESLNETNLDLRGQIKELREMIYQLQKDKYGKGEIVMEGAPQTVEETRNKRKV